MTRTDELPSRLTGLTVEIRILRRLTLQTYHISQLLASITGYGYTEQTVASALSTLRRRGWVTNDGHGRWSIAEAGLRIVVDQRQQHAMSRMLAEIRVLREAIALLETLRNER